MKLKDLKKGDKFIFAKDDVLTDIYEVKGEIKDGSPFNPLKARQYSPNGIIITGFEDMNYHVDTPSPNPGI